MEEEAVEPQEQAEPIEQMVEEAQADADVQEERGVEESQPAKKTMIPLSVAQKLREQKRDLELELQWERQRNAQQQVRAPEPDPDDSRFESATREDLSKSQRESLRMIEEKLWTKANAEKYEFVNENLPKFLKQRPNLASAIAQAENRYEEAYTLMTALSQKEQKHLVKSPAQKKEAPNAPSGVPKAASLNETVDVMNMSDSDFNAWRRTQKRKR